MACEVAALTCGSGFCRLGGEPKIAGFLQDTADAWNDAIDEYTFVEGTELAKKHDVDGYYIRIAPPEIIEDRSLKHLRIKLPNHILATGRERRRILSAPTH